MRIQPKSIKCVHPTRCHSIGYLKMEDPEKSVSSFCGIFLTYPDASKSYGIQFLATKQHFQWPEIRIFHDFKNFYHFGDVFEHGWSKYRPQNSADTVLILYWHCFGTVFGTTRALKHHQNDRNFQNHEKS